MVRNMALEIKAEDLGNIAYARLAELMEDDLGKTSVEKTTIREAEFLIQIMKEISEQTPFITLRIKYD